MSPARSRRRARDGCLGRRAGRQHHPGGARPLQLRDEVGEPRAAQRPRRPARRPRLLGEHDDLVPARISRRAMLPPMRPRPIIPICRAEFPLQSCRRSLKSYSPAPATPASDRACFTASRFMRGVRCFTPVDALNPLSGGAIQPLLHLLHRFCFIAFPAAPPTRPRSPNDGACSHRHLPNKTPAGRRGRLT